MTEPNLPDTDSTPSLEGSNADLGSEQALRDAIEQAFDYRGDITIETTEGQSHEGYLFDRRGDADPPVVRVLTKAGERVTIPYAEIQRLTFSGKDAAHGKSWENWVRRYVEKKTRGEDPSLEAEKFD